MTSKPLSPHTAAAKDIAFVTLFTLVYAMVTFERLDSGNTMQHNQDDNDNNSSNGNDNNSNSETMRFQNAMWPESLPEPTEEHIFTLLCGNTHVNWSLHMGARHKFAAKLHWRYVLCYFLLSLC
jgi:hypothetical protein